MEKQNNSDSSEKPQEKPKKRSLRTEREISLAVTKVQSKIKGFSAENPSSIEKAMMKGILLQLQGNHDQALDYFKDLLAKINSHNFENELQIVEYIYHIMVSKNQEKEGVQFIEQFITQYPRESVEANPLLATIYVYLGNYYFSIEMFKEANRAYEIAFRYWNQIDQKNDLKLELLDKIIQSCEKIQISAEEYQNHLNKYLEIIKKAETMQQKGQNLEILQDIYNLWIVRNEDDICLFHYPQSQEFDPDLFASYLNVVNLLGQNNLKAGTLNGLDFTNFRLVWYRNPDYTFHILAQVNRHAVHTQIMDKLFKICARFNQEFQETLLQLNANLMIYHRYTIIVEKPLLFEDTAKEPFNSSQIWMNVAKNMIRNNSTDIETINLCFDQAIYYKNLLDPQNQVEKATLLSNSINKWQKILKESEQKHH